MALAELDQFRSRRCQVNSSTLASAQPLNAQSRTALQVTRQGDCEAVVSEYRRGRIQPCTLCKRASDKSLHSEATQHALTPELGAGDEGGRLGGGGQQVRAGAHPALRAVLRAARPAAAAAAAAACTRTPSAAPRRLGMTPAGARMQKCHSLSRRHTHWHVLHVHARSGCQCISWQHRQKQQRRRQLCYTGWRGLAGSRTCWPSAACSSACVQHAGERECWASSL